MDAIRTRIMRGEYPPGSRLPSGSELRTEFDVSTPTAGSAMRALADQGYVDVRQGVGAFVSANPVLTPLVPAEEQREVVVELRAEARRLTMIADRLARTLESRDDSGAADTDAAQP